MKSNTKPIPVAAKVTMDEAHSAWGILFQIMLLFTGLASYLFCNTTALKMEISPVVILLIAALSFGLMVLLSWFKRVFYGVLGGLATLTLITYPISFPLLKKLFFSLEVCYNYTIYLLASQPEYSDYKDYFTLNIESYIEVGIMGRHFYAAIILLALIAAVFFALALFRRIPPILSFLVPMLGLVPLFFYGTVPNYFAFSVFLSAMIGCYAQSVIQRMRKVKTKRARKAPKAPKQKVKLTSAQRLNFASTNGRFGIIVTAVMLVITLGTATFIYSRPVVELTQVRETIDHLSEDAMNLVFSETYERNLHIAGYMEEGEKLELDVPKFRRLKVATVETKTSTPVYLRYRTTVELTPEGWTIPEEEFNAILQEEVPFDFRENTQFYQYMSLTDPKALKADLDEVESEEHGFVRDVITVTPQYKVSNLLGIPGGTIEPNPSSDYTDLERFGDTVLMHHDQPENRAYTYEVISPLFSSNEFLANFQNNQEAYLKLRAEYSGKDSYMNDELEYSMFVMRNYTTMHADLQYNVQPLARELTDRYDTTLEKAQAIERYLRENYTYSTNRVRLTLEDGSPADAFDQIHYFLLENEAKEGYCTLFASSMAAMLRSINIPARVASGYYVTPEFVDVNQFSSAINDNTYHAWTEVYFPGIGWVPFEPTPGFGVERNYYLLDLADKGEEPEGADQEVEIEYVDPEDAGIVIYDKIPDVEQEIPEETPETEMPEEKYEQSGYSVWKTVITEYAAWILLGLVLLFLGGIIFFFIWFYRHQKRSVRTLPPNQGVQAAYIILLRMVRMRGFKFFEGELLESFARRFDNLNLAPHKMQPLLPIYQKALFGNLEISEQERVAVANFTDGLVKATFKRCPLKAPWYCLIMKKKPRHHKMIWKFK